MPTSTGSAPGRLDVMGGVADYSGALVIEMPSIATTVVETRPSDCFRVGNAALTRAELTNLAALAYADVREALAALPKWVRYPIGVVLVLVRHGVIDPPAVECTITSEVPQSVGVSSSAALEVATARALAPHADPMRVALLCQEAENHIVGAPCGVMDQVAVSVGRPGALLPILCRPASFEPAIDLPPWLEIVGWPTGAEHEVSGLPYRRARTAAFMGKRMIETSCARTFAWTSEIPADALRALPEVVDGASFLHHWRGTDDIVTTVEPDLEYPVRAATTFGVEEHGRSAALIDALQRDDTAALRPLFAASHRGYDAMGLGHPAADAVVDAALARPGVYGARSSGGGSGGTVIVCCERGALDDVEDLIR